MYLEVKKFWLMALAFEKCGGPGRRNFINLCSSEPPSSGDGGMNDELEASQKALF